MLHELLVVTKALADEHRLRMLGCLHHRELYACHFRELFQISASTVCKHLTILRQAQLIRARRTGRWVRYRLAVATAPRAAQDAIQWVLEDINTDIQVVEDLKRIAEFQNVDPADLGLRQRRTRRP